MSAIRNSNNSLTQLKSQVNLSAFRNRNQDPNAIEMKTFRRTAAPSGNPLKKLDFGLKLKDHFLKAAKEEIVVIPFENDPDRPQRVDLSNFLPLGYATKQNNEKQYRKFVSVNLEASDFMGKELFFTLPINRGKRVNLKKEGLLSRIFSTKEEKFREVGKFRGIIEVLEEETINRIGQLHVPRSLLKEFHVPYDADSFKFSEVDKEILKSVDVLIRIYVIDALFVKSLDFNSENDSYLVLDFNGKETKGESRIDDRNNPRYFSTFQFEHKLPGPSDIKIKFYDYDPIKFDEFIGETVIDVERRFFDQRWRGFKNHPIETRGIFHPSSSIDVGTVRLFVEVWDKNRPVPPVVKIKPRAKTKLQLRVIIWEVWDVPAQDFEDVSDLYLTVSLPEFNMKMKTDTHFRAQGGYGSFNWRTIFNIDIDEYFKSEMANLQLLVYDRDLFSANDYVAVAELNFADLIEQTLYEDTRSKMSLPDENGKDSLKFVLNAPLKLKDEDKKKDVKIRLSVDLLTEEQAKISPAGIGRGDPNQDPFLEGPKGRFQWTLNPLKLFEQLVGPQFRKQACLICCVTFCVLIVIMLIPVFFSEILATLFTKAIGL